MIGDESFTSKYPFRNVEERIKMGMYLYSGIESRIWYILTNGYLRRVRLVTHKSPFFIMYPCIPTCTIGSRLVCCVHSGGREKHGHRIRTCTLRVQSPPAYDAIREYHEIPDPWTIYEGICSLLEARMFQAKTHGRRFKIRSS